MDVFHHKEDRMLVGLRQQPGQHGLHGLVLVPLGRQSEGWIRSSRSGSDSKAAKRGTASASGRERP